MASRISGFKMCACGLLPLFFILTGCVNLGGKSASSPAADNPAAAGSAPALKNTIIYLAGSGSCEASLKLIKAPFEKAHPGVTLNFLPSTSSGDGIKGAGEGLLDVGLTARTMKTEEKIKYPGLRERMFLKDAVVLAVNKNVGIKNITTGQIVKIFNGEITNWKKLGGPDGKIVLLDREESESSKMLLRKNFLGSDLQVTKSAILINSAETMNRAIEDTKNTIGQTSIASVLIGGYKNIVPLAIDNIAPTPQNVANGSYKLVREYGLVISLPAEKNGVNDLADYVYEDEAINIFSKYDSVPVGKK